MDEDLKKQLKRIADTIRQLSIEAVQKANSGHPGLPLGCAEIGTYLYARQLKHNPKNSKWINRDRFVLSAGHGSMLLYSCLHLAGFNLSLDQIKMFRQLHSQTPGHPEYSLTDGVEATTGPLGHGIGNAVGMALGMKILQRKFNTDEYKIFDNKIYCLAGDGCIMEGASSEASSLAGHLQLDNLVVIYDSNKVSLDGPLSDSCSEDTKMRYRSYGWDVLEIDGHDFDTIDEVFSKIKHDQKSPVLVVAHTIIGKGSPHMAGSYKVHGVPLGEEEVKATKAALDLPEEQFYVPQSVYDYFKEKREKQEEEEKRWNEVFRIWSKTNPQLFKELEKMRTREIPEDLEEILVKIELPSPLSGRRASHHIINELAEILPFLYSGSADLSSSDMTKLDNFDIISSGNFQGRNIKFGVREFGMGTISNGLALTGMILPLCGTFLTFSDYMRNAIRLSAMSSLQIVYQLTHDSIFLGEDGPTHQPVEHLASLRAIPNLQVIRPADSWEVKMAWIAALRYEGPTALVLSRQPLPALEVTKLAYKDGVGRGAYIVKRERQKPDFTLLATGSELQLALNVAVALEKLDREVRVVSFPSSEIFDKQPLEYKEMVLGGDIGKRVSIEAGVDLGWYKYIGRDGISICVESFGYSAPARDLAEEFGFTTESILERLMGCYR